ncbi:MAG: hypothetical protein JWM28_4272, partial [Chitinophagaceae bacterium]|nr:hypothetical protein [Chitinophagaceae bacterium]
LRAEFMPGVGIVYVAAINPTTGGIIYSVSKYLNNYLKRAFFEWSNGKQLTDFSGLSLS